MKIISVIHDEFKAIITNYAVLLVLMGGIFVYGLLYNYIYAPDLVRKVPVSVVDHSHSELSRHYVRLLNATSQVDVVAIVADYWEAQEMMKSGQVFGILYLPDDFEDRVARDEESVFMMYETTSAFLYYLSMQEASASSMLALNDDIRTGMLDFLSQQDASAFASTQTVGVVGSALYNPTEGYGTYLIPAVLIVIIFQTLMMVIGMISGEERGTGSIVRFADDSINPSFARMAQVVIGKAFVYGMLYAVFILFLLGLIPLLFDLPNIGNPFYVIMLMIPFLLGTVFWGLTATLFFTDSDAPILMIAFFSVGLIFLSGVSYPIELMPWYWKLTHYLLPAPPAIMAYVKLNSMQASMNEIRFEYITLWIQCVFYFITACWVYKYNIRKALIKRKG